MKAEALRGSRLSADQIDGAVLAQTLLVPDDHHRVLLLKGRILTRADWPVVASARVEEVHVVRMDPGDIHEDEAARRLARVVAGPGVIAHGPVESQARLSAEINGIFTVDVQRLQALNSIEDISVFTLFDGQLVSSGKTIAGVKVTPFVVPEARLGEAERVAGTGEGIVRVLAFRPMRVAVLVRERLEPAQREKFQASIEMKVAWFGSSISEIRYVADDVAAVEAAVRGLLRDADLLLTAGANATDPLDPTLVALGRLHARMEKQGAPAHPGSAVWLAYLSDKPIFGVAACGMFSKATVLDLILPRLFTGARVTAADFNELGHGGLLSKDMAFRFPPYGAFDTLDSNRARVFGGAEAILSACQRSHEATTIGQNDMFGGASDAPTIMLPQVEPWLPAERLRREYDAIGFFLSGHPLDDYATVLKRLRVQSWAEFSRAVKTGATAGKVAATVVSRMERRTKTGNKMGIMGLSDPTGHFEAVLFSEGLAQYRDVLEPGAAVLLQLGAELQGEDVRARVLHAELLDDAAAKTQKGLRIFVRDTRPLESIARRLQMPEAGQGAPARSPQAKPAPAPAGGADGDVSLVMMLDLETEVEMKLPGRFKVSPQIAGAIKAVSGVVDVQTL